MEREKLEGKKFNRLTIIKFISEDKHYNKKYLCQCDCGNLIYTYLNLLRSNHTKSCGCLHKEIVSYTLSKTRCSKLNTILNKEQQQIFDGLILSDASIGILNKGINPSFKLNSITKSFINKIKETMSFQWCKLTKTDACYKNGINCSTKYTLQSKTDIGLLKEYHRWYKNKIKIVPKDIEISPLLLKYWFYGDGSTSWNKRTSKTVSLRLYTNGFILKECEFLQNKLQNIGLYFNINKGGNPATSTNQGRGYILTMSSKDNILKFFNYIGPCDVDGFSYKWKIPYYKNKWR